MSVEQICQAIKLAGFDEVFLVAEAAGSNQRGHLVIRRRTSPPPLDFLILPGNRAADPSPILRTNSQSNQTGIPVEVAAKLAKEEVCRLYDLPPEEA